MLKTPLVPQFRYPYEEFADHMKAMKTVSKWEYTSRFGHIGNVQTSRANSARVVEYFFDIYVDKKEAVQKAELFLSIYDYIGRHTSVFTRTDLAEGQEGGLLEVEPALLRAVHYVFTNAGGSTSTDPKKVLGLAKAFKEVEPAG